MDNGGPIGERHAPVAKHLFSDTPRPVTVKQRVQHKTHERRHTLAHAGADACRLSACSARSERVKKTGGLGVEPQGGVALALYALGVTSYHKGDFKSARRWLMESLELNQGLGNIGTAQVLAHLGDVATYQGDTEGAGRLLDEALALMRRLKDRYSIPVALRFQSRLAHVRGDWAGATRLLHESLALTHAMGGYWEIAACLEGLAGLAEGQGQSGRATRLWDAAAVLRKEIGAPLPPADHVTYETAVARTQRSLGDQGFASAWAEGQAMTLEQAIAYALDESNPE